MHHKGKLSLNCCRTAAPGDAGAIVLSACIESRYRPMLLYVHPAGVKYSVVLVQLNGFFSAVL